MFRRLFRLSFRLGLLGGIGFAIFKMVQARRPSQETYPGRTEPWPPVKPTPRPEPSAAPATPAKVVEAAPKPVVAAAAAPAPAPAKKAAPAAKKAQAPTKKAAGETKPAPDRAWVEPSGDGVCPTSHPIKAKLTSKIFHLPGMFAYDRCKPDRCYAAEAAAAADGLTKAKR